MNRIEFSLFHKKIFKNRIEF